jgi:hypothetical protein
VISDAATVAEPVTRTPATAAGDAPTTDPSAPVSTWFTGRRVVRVAAGLIALQLVLRAWVAAGGFLYWDDFILAGRSVQFPLLSTEFLLYDHDGHVMPAGFLLTGILTRLAPLEWWPMVVALVVMQALASLAVWRMLRLLLGDRPVVLVPLVLCLYSPLTIPSFTWWAAALNALPLMAGMAWFVGDAIQLQRTGRRRYAVSGVLALVAALCFFEKSVVIPFVAFGVVSLLLRNAGETRPIHTAFRRCGWLWGGALGVLAGWGVAYALVAGSPAVAPEDAGTVPQAIELLERGLLQGLLPSLVGGPLSWDQIWPGTPYATPTTGVVVLGCLLPAAAVALTVRHRRGGGVVWWLVGGYVGVSAVAMIVARSGLHTPEVLPQTLRYFADSVVVIGLAIALLVDAPRREPARRHRRRMPLVPLAAAVGAVLLFLVGSVWSTVDHVRTWDESLSPGYLVAARASLAAATGEPLLDHEVPQQILWPLARPHNRVSRFFAPLEDRPPFGEATADLRMLDAGGSLVEASVDPARWLEPGPVDGCGFAVPGGGTTRAVLDGPLWPREWTAQLNYLASEDGVLEVSLDGDAVRTPVREGANSVYVRLTGGGATISVSSPAPGLGLCLDSGVVGDMVPAGG